MSVTLSGICPLPLSGAGFHSHNTWEIILNLEGTGTDIVGKEEYPFYKGSIICIPPNTRHSKITDKQFKDIFIQSTDFFISNYPKVLCFEDDEEKSIETLMRMAHKAFHKQDKNYINISDTLFRTIQHMLIGNQNKIVRNQNVEQLIGLIVENFTDPEFEVSQAIASLPYHKDYLRRMFHSETGKTPVGYMTWLRLEHAKRLLEQKSVTDYSVSEIALMCGYYDPRYFNRLFKRNIGMSPLQYIESQ